MLERAAIESSPLGVADEATPLISTLTYYPQMHQNRRNNNVLPSSTFLAGRDKLPTLRGEAYVCVCMSMSMRIIYIYIYLTVPLLNWFLCKKKTTSNLKTSKINILINLNLMNKQKTTTQIQSSKFFGNCTIQNYIQNKIKLFSAGINFTIMASKIHVIIISSLLVRKLYFLYKQKTENRKRTNKKRNGIMLLLFLVFMMLW